MSESAFGPDLISDWFWEIIREANRDRQRLRDILEKMSREDMIRFDAELREAAVQLTDPPFTDHMPDLSEDSIDDVTRWVVSQGKEYYKGLKGGLGRGEALRQMQLSMLKRNGREHPFYWASFIQAGEWAPLDGQR